MSIEKKIQEHQKVVQQLKVLKEREMEMRVELIEELGAKGTGTHKFSFGAMDVKVVRGLSYSLDQKKVAAGWDDWTEAGRGAVRVKYELAVTAYKALDICGDIDDALTVKDSAPTIEVKYNA